ncbi:MAG: hypothetical protein MJK18_09355, partial [Bdellovibrionales bacterium]|nr:hypothetical protein [Bdellovibrionales bacterium]
RRQSPNFRRDEYEVMNDIDFDRYIEEAIHDTEELEEFRRNRGFYSIATLPQAERFWFGPLKMRFVRIMPGETATDRTLMYSVTTCVKHALTGAAVGPGLQFDITTWDKKDGTATPEDPGRPHHMRRQTNESGCLTWFGFLSHKFYHKEVLTEKKADVRFVGTRVERSQWDDIRNKYQKDFIYYMNAWDEKWTFGWDRPDMPEDYPSQIAEQRATAPASKLFIADFKYETMGFRYAIDKYLKLKVKKAVLLKAYPYVLKYNSIVLGRNATNKLRDGVYLMKIALQKDYLDPAAKGVRIYDRQTEEALTLDSNPTGPRPELRYSTDSDVADRSAEQIDHRLLTQEELQEGHKQYISIQQKLVRVIGGMIITPIEFEVSD